MAPTRRHSPPQHFVVLAAAADIAATVQCSLRLDLVAAAGRKVTGMVVAATVEGHNPKHTIAATTGHNLKRIITAAIAGHNPERIAAATAGHNPERTAVAATTDRNPNRTTTPAVVGQSQVEATHYRLQREEGPARSSLAGYC